MKEPIVIQSLGIPVSDDKESELIISKFDLDTKLSIIQFILPFSLFWHSKNEIISILTKENIQSDTPLLLKVIIDAMDIQNEDSARIFNDFISKIELFNDNNVTSCWDWWKDTYIDESNFIPKCKYINDEGINDTIIRNPELYSNEIVRLPFQTNPSIIEENLQQEDEDCWSFHYSKKKHQCAPSIQLIQKLRDIDKEKKISILWDIFIISITSNKGLDANFHSFLLVASLFLDLDPKSVLDFESKYALVTTKAFEAMEEDEPILSGQSGRWWKIGLGAAVRFSINLFII